jgi:UPF0176 protein
MKKSTQQEPKVILYYKFVPVNDPNITMRWQKELCARLGLKGRIIISPHGINGTLGGGIENLREYKREMNRSVLFKGIMYKWSDGNGEEFPKLSVKVREELVAFHASDEIVVSEQGIENGGTHLKPEQVHQLIKERGDEVIFFDGRNAYEAQVGRFKNAVITAVETTPDFLKELEHPKYDAIKDRPIITYCTGGIRCEILSVLMKNRGFKEVYQIDGVFDRCGMCMVRIYLKAKLAQIIEFCNLRIGELLARLCYIIDIHIEWSRSSDAWIELAHGARGSVARIGKFLFTAGTLLRV